MAFWLCGHSFCVLKVLHAGRIPSCCVLSRWSIHECKSWVSFPLIRKSSTYDTSQSLDKHRELDGLSHQASFRASQPCRRTGLNAFVGHHQAHLLSANRYMICSVVSVLLFFNDDLAISIGFLFLGFSIGVLFAHTNCMRFRNPSGYFLKIQEGEPLLRFY
jgi:hypothetical protein